VVITQWKLEGNTIHRIDSDKCNILFVGGYYYPNVNGFRWFIKNVTPLIKINYEVTLVGNRMDLLKEEFSNNSNVKVLGRVEDLSPYYEDADVVVGPIFEGAGMKVKTAEALSYTRIDFLVDCNCSDILIRISNSIANAVLLFDFMYDLYYKSF
jgi:hypothetical protein B2_15733